MYFSIWETEPFQEQSLYGYVHTCPQSQSQVCEDTIAFLFPGEVISETPSSVVPAPAIQALHRLPQPLPGLAWEFSQPRQGDCCESLLRVKYY